MTSIKSLLQSKRSQSQLQIQHEFASYNSITSQLTCTLCSIKLMKSDPIFWSTHLISKQHRRNHKLAQEQSRLGGGNQGQSVHAEEEVEETAPELPDDFYEDPSQRPTLPISSSPAVTTTAQSAQDGDNDNDDEWAAFEATLAVPSTNILPSTTPNNNNTLSATTRSAPVLYQFGAPIVVPLDETNNPKPDQNELQEEEEEEEETEDEKRERLAREEREEMIERMDKEVREQEEGDEKVVVSIPSLFLSFTLSLSLSLVTLSSSSVALSAFVVVPLVSPASFSASLLRIHIYIVADFALITTQKQALKARLAMIQQRRAEKRLQQQQIKMQLDS